MVEISCYYIYSNRNPRYIVFIRYEKFMKMILSGYRTIIMSIDNFNNDYNLFQYYCLSLIMTEDNTKIYRESDKEYIDNRLRYGVSIELNWKNLYFTDNFRIQFLNIKKNPFNSIEPKKETTSKKINKFYKNFYKDFQQEPLKLIEIIIKDKCKSSVSLINNLEIGIKIENRIKILTGIRKKYGDDIYYLIRKYF